MINIEESAIFLILAMDASMQPLSRGSAFTVNTPDLLVTCAHVVAGSNKILVVKEQRVFEGKNSTEAETIALDEATDLAILRPTVAPDSFLELDFTQGPDKGSPILVWGWPGLERDQSFSDIDLTPVAQVGLFARMWADNLETFTFATHLKPGMSGGPVVSFKSRKVWGIVREEEFPQNFSHH